MEMEKLEQPLNSEERYLCAIACRLDKIIEQNAELIKYFKPVEEPKKEVKVEKAQETKAAPKKDAPKRATAAKKPIVEKAEPKGCAEKKE